MLDENQREVAVHLLANAIRRSRIAAARRPDAAAAGGSHHRGRRTAEDDYLRGMVDLARALYGAAESDGLLRAARALEQTQPAD